MVSKDNNRAASKKGHNAGHRKRLRTRLARDMHNAPAYELLEGLLFYVHPRKDMKPVAKEMLEKFGTLAGVLDARPAELEAIAEAGPSTSLFIMLLREVMARYMVEEAAAKKSVSLDDIGQLSRCRLAGCAHEEVWAALLDNGNRLITFIQVSSGSVDQVLISPRDAVEVTLRHKATGLVLVHNHPGGSQLPSLLDRETTRQLAIAMEAVGLRFLDHLIIADGRYYSLTKDRLLP